MSATLTPERKSARDRPGVERKMAGDWGRERGWDIGASTEELAINKPARNQFLTHTPEGSAGLSCLACSDRSALHLAYVLAVDALAAHVAAVACMRSISLAAALARAVAGPPHSAALSLSAAALSPAQPEHLRCCITGTYFARHLKCSARTRMREIIWCVAGCGAQSGAPSTALAIMLNRFCTVDGPLSGPKRSKTRR